MPVESADDRASFLSPAEFGSEATYMLAAGGSKDVTGSFNNSHLSVAINDAPVSDSAPTFLCRADDLPDGAEGGDSGDALVLDGDTWRVTDLQPDGTGMVLLTLGRDA